MSQVTTGAVDIAGRSVEAMENAVGETKKAVDETVPAIVRFVGSFVLPEILNYQVSRVASIATNVGTTVAASGAHFMANAATFGAPTWLKAARKALATRNEITRGEWNTGTEFLAHCLAENTSTPIIKDELKRYVHARAELARALSDSAEEAPRVQELRASIVEQEATLRSYGDYVKVKEVLDRGFDYVRENFDQIVKLAEKTADSILRKAENYYTDRLGGFGGKIEGTYGGAQTDAEQQTLRNELRDRIAVRLKEVFANELQSDEVRGRLSGVRSELLESFGAYREGITALSYVALGACYYTGGLAVIANEALEYADGVKDAAFAYVGQTFDAAWKSATGWLWDHTFGAAASGASSFLEAVGRGVNEFWDVITPDMPDFLKRRLGF
jgi:hypothetical protein